MTALGAIPSTSPIDRASMGRSLETPYAVHDSAAGPWPQVFGMPLLTAGDTVSAFFSTDYLATAGGPYGTVMWIEYQRPAGTWGIAGNTLHAYLFFNIAYSHEVHSMAVHSFHTPTPAAIAYRLSISNGISSGGDDFSAGFTFVVGD